MLAMLRVRLGIAYCVCQFVAFFPVVGPFSGLAAVGLLIAYFVRTYGLMQEIPPEAAQGM
jgi:hypothetical protein